MKKCAAVAAALVILLSLNILLNENRRFRIPQTEKIGIKTWDMEGEVYVTEESFIQRITEDIQGLRFEKTSGKDPLRQYRYVLTWYGADGEMLERITITEESGCQIYCEGNYYKVGADHSIDLALIDAAIRNARKSQ